jgi:hypothetical protein
MSPSDSRPGTKGWRGCEVLASTSWPIRVREYPKRNVARVWLETLRRYSAVRNWFFEMKVRGNWGNSVGRS